MDIVGRIFFGGRGLSTRLDLVNWGFSGDPGNGDMYVQAGDAQPSGERIV
jgi:hypothetical protein